MQKTYSRINWENYPSGSTPINETNLNKMDVAINEIDDRIIQFDTTKLDKTSASGLLKGFSLDEETGVITLTYYDGSTQTISSNMAKIAVNVSYDPEMQCLVLTMPDGSVSYVDMTELITMYEFTASDTIYFEIDFNGNVSAKIKNNSITEAHLQTDYLANIKVETANSAQNREVAEASAILAKDYAEQAKESAEQALSTTPDGYNQMVEDVDLLKNAIIQTTDRTLYGSKEGGIKLIGIKGASEQGENPSPDNPQEIESVGDLKNLLDYSVASQTVSGVTYTINLDKTITANGIGGAGNSVFWLIPTSAPMTLSAGKYIISGYPSTNIAVGDISIRDVNLKAIAQVIYGKREIEFELTEDTEIVAYIAIYNGVTANNLTFKPMIRKASVSNAEYKPYGYSLGIKAEGKNLYDANTAIAYNVESTGELTAINTARLTDFLPVMGKNITVSGEFMEGKTNVSGYRIALYDSEKNFIERKVKVDTDTWTWDVSAYSYIRLCFFTSELDENSIQLEWNDTVTTYEPYRSKSITIPLNEPLREGDEIAVADGVWGALRKIAVHNTANVTSVGTSAKENANGTIYNFNLPNGTNNAKTYSRCTARTYCMTKDVSTLELNEYTLIYTTTNQLRVYYVSTCATTSEALAELQAETSDVHYELATPTFEPFTDQTPFYGLESFDTVTYISTDSKVEPNVILKFAKTEGDAITLGNYNQTNLNRIAIAELTSAVLALNQE